MFKVGLVRALSDMLLNQGETHDASRKLLLPGAQKMLRQVLGDELAILPVSPILPDDYIHHLLAPFATANHLHVVNKLCQA